MNERMTKIILITIATVFLAVMLVAPLAVVMIEALKQGVAVYWASLQEPYAQKAIYLTIFTVVVAITLNSIFSILAAWAITKFDFKGKIVFESLIQLPLAISPVIIGLMLILMYGRQSPLYTILRDYDISVVFSIIGVTIAVIFVTIPFIVQGLVPLMKVQSRSEEEAATLMGASWWTIFWNVTFPNIRFALMYGIVLASSRAMGEFGAVSVISGHIRGRTNTLPLHVELLYNEYNFTAAFAVASVLVMASIILLIIRNILEWIGERRLQE